MTHDVRSAVQAWALRAGYRLGWAVGPRLSPAVCRRLADLAGGLAVRLRLPAIDTIRANLRGLTGREPTTVLVRATVSSWTRNFLEAFALRGWSRADILASVSARGDERLRAAVAETGAVVALPHSGNWDLAGAWACLTGMLVVTVAEELTGPVAPEYAAFRRLREALGMRVLSHKAPRLLATLVDAAVPGTVVCLVADRALAGSGLPVRWGARTEAPTAHLPIGPALVARRANVPLFPVVSRYTDRGIALTIGTPIEPAPGRAGLVSMTQQLAGYFAELLARRPEDWHVMVPFFDPPTLTASS